MAEFDLPSTYGRVAAVFSARVAGCSPGRWVAQSPCEEWTARDVALHVIGNHRGMLGQPPPDSSADVPQAWAEASAAMAAALADPQALAKAPGGPFGASTLGDLARGLLLCDTSVHTWDLARATGQDETLDPEAVHVAFPWLRSLGDRIRRPGGFHAPVEPPPNASEQVAFICYTGRVV